MLNEFRNGGPRIIKIGHSSNLIAFLVILNRSAADYKLQVKNSHAFPTRMVEISIVLIVLVVVAIGAFTAWRVMSKNKKNKQIQNDY